MPDELKTAVDDIKKSLTEHKASFDTEVDKKFADAKKLADEANKKIEEEVKAINEDLTNKGKTLEEIREAINEFKAKAGRFSAGSPTDKLTVDILREEIKANHDSIKGVKKGSAASFETKSVGNMTASANLTGAVVNQYSLTPALRGRRKVHFQDMVSTVQSSTGLWSFYRQNTPSGEGSFGFQTTHGAAKAQLDYDLTKVDVTCEYLAGHVRFAKQMAQDLPFLQSFVANEMLEDYRRQEDLEFFGLLRSAATGNITTSASVYAEKLIDYLANLMDADWDPNGIVTTAANWATLLKTKPADYSIPGGIVITPDGTITIAGVPVYVANSLYLGSSSNKTLVGQWDRASIIEADGLRSQFFEQDQDNVVKNLITARVERRVGLAILRPDAFIYA